MTGMRECDFDSSQRLMMSARVGRVRRSRNPPSPCRREPADYAEFIMVAHKRVGWVERPRPL